ncbi:hypothetical protein [Pseudoxanthomonas sp. USHLN014]|uniref:hypothetical protein n=1 Tax=Pseudoxanthomonas sp. USHLN014 TaxID=3081297 RepID=UPI00301C3B50
MAAVSFAISSLLIVVAIFNVRYSQYERAVGYVAERHPKSIVASPLPTNTSVNEIFVQQGDSLIPGKAIASVVPDKDLPKNQFSANANSFFFAPQVKDSAEKSVIISSTVAGRVDNILVREGASLSPMQPLVTISTAEPRTYFQILAPGSVVSHLEVGSDISISISDINESDLAGYRGVVTRISHVGMSPMEVSSLLGIPPPPGPRYLIEVDPKTALNVEQQRVVRPGMSVLASIKTRERTLASWILNKKE